MGYQSQLKAFTEWMGKNYPQVKEMRAVRTQHAEGYADHLGMRRLSPSTYNQHLNTLALVWAVLTKKARIDHNPFVWDKKTRTGIRRKSVKAQACARKKRALTVDEINSLIDHATGDIRTLLVILTCTGQRLVDGVKLKWEAVDFEKRIITLIPQKTASRTGKQVFIPMLPQLVCELKSMKRKDCYVLPKLVALYERDAGSTLSKSVRKVFDNAGLTATRSIEGQSKRAVVDTGAHSLRHSFVTIARLAGFPDPLIRQITGHTTEEMVDHYTQFSEKLVASLAAQIPHVGNGKAIVASNPKSPIPEWVKDKLKSMDDDNWETIRKELLA
jgi:integrase